MNTTDLASHGDRTIPPFVIDDEREAVRLRNHRGNQITWLVFYAIVVVLSFALDGEGTGALHVGGTDGWKLPPLCGSRIVLGIDCPGCGLTRSFSHLAHGRFAEAWRLHRLGGLFATALFVAVIYRFQLIREANRGIIYPRRWPRVASWCLIGLLIGNWVLSQIHSG